MSNALFPTFKGASFDNERGRRFKTIVRESSSGIEVTDQLADFPRLRWHLPIEYLKDADLQTLEAFFDKHGGKAESFLLLDAHDTIVVAQQIGVGTGAKTVFDVSRTRPNPGGFTQPINWLQAVANLTVGGVPKTNPADYTFANEPARITFAAAPANAAVIVADITYYWRVRFDTDEPDFREFLNNLHATDAVELLQKKP